MEDTDKVTWFLSCPLGGQYFFGALCGKCNGPKEDNSDWLANEGTLSYEGPLLRVKKSKWGRNGWKQAAAPGPSNLVVAPVKLYMLSYPPGSHKCCNFW